MKEHAGIIVLTIHTIVWILTSIQTLNTMQIFKHLLILFTANFIVSINAPAQTPVDIIPEHVVSGVLIYGDLIDYFDTELISRNNEIIATGKMGSVWKLKFNESVSKQSFKTAVNRIVSNSPYLSIPMGGWTDEQGDVWALIQLDVKEGYRGGMIVLYNPSSRITVLTIMTSKL